MSASRAIAASNVSGSRLRSRASGTRVSTFSSPARATASSAAPASGLRVGCEDRAGGSDTLSRQERLLAGASGDIEDSLADVDSGQIKPALGQQCYNLRTGNAAALPSGGGFRRSIRSAGRIRNAVFG
jgi:hypothetical protein